MRVDRAWGTAGVDRPNKPAPFGKLRRQRSRLDAAPRRVGHHLAFSRPAPYAGDVAAETERRRRHSGSKRIVSLDPTATRFFLDLPRDLLPSDLNIAKPNHDRAADLVRACARDSSVALANKLARIISAVMTTGEAFRTETIAHERAPSQDTAYPVTRARLVSLIRSSRSDFIRAGGDGSAPDPGSERQKNHCQSGPSTCDGIDPASPNSPPREEWRNPALTDGSSRIRPPPLIHK